MSLSSATLPAPAMLHPTAIAADDALVSLSCTVHLAAGRLNIVSTVAAATTLHFSTAYMLGTVTNRDSIGHRDSAAAAPAQPWSLSDWVPPRPALPRRFFPAVTGGVAAPANGTDGYRLHPAILDGCFQLGAAVPAMGALQPVSNPIRGFACLRADSASLRLCARVERICA